MKHTDLFASRIVARMSSVQILGESSFREKKNIVKPGRKLEKWRIRVLVMGSRITNTDLEYLWQHIISLELD